MKHAVIKTIVVLLCVFGLGFCCTQNTSAIITGAWVDWNSGIDWDGGTTFGVGLDYNTWGEQTSSFRCISPGYDYTSSICDWNEWWEGNDAYWDYYYVELYSCSGGEQDIGGHIRTRRWYTLNAYARVNGSGAYLNNGNTISSEGNWSGYSANAYSGWYNPEGYTFANWGVTPSDMSRYTNTSDNRTRDITWRSLEWDQNLDAYYDRNAFQGRAYASSNGVSADTGYQSGSSLTRNATAECANGGCTANFELDLKTTSGAGATPYSIYKQKNGGSWTYVTSGSTYPSAGGSVMLRPSETLYPGQSACYRIYFRPYGAYSNTSEISETACITAKVTTFQGTVSISGATGGNTGWRDLNYSQNFYINNCSPTAGCKVTFTDTMRRSSGTMGSSAWRSNRYSNLITSTRAISTAQTGSGTFNTSQANVKTDGEYTLYPGMVLCQRLTFNPNNNATITVNDVYVQACASALGNAQPGDPNLDTPESPTGNSGDTAFLNIKVKNGSIGTNYQREVYAKPTDVLTYRATYNPVLQYTYYLKPQQMRIDGGTIYTNSGTVPPDGSTLAAMFNSKKSPGWNNDFSVFSANFSTGQYSQNFSFDNGSMTKQVKTNNHTVQGGEVGKSLNETAKTNVNSTTQTTPSQVAFTNNGDRNLANVITAAIERIAYARIPYNFINTTNVTTSTDKVMYAGEDASFDFTIATNPKQNRVTNGTYATVVRGAKWKLELCYNNNSICQETVPTSVQNSMGNTSIGDLNAGFSYGGTTTSKSLHVNIPDTTAGSQVCVRSAVYPANSGADTNWANPEGSATWAYSNRVCYVVAKKPSMEIWGGNIYSRGMLESSVSTKKNLANYNNYNIETKYDKEYIFGSWGELGVISSGTIKGLSSGAGLGFKANDGGTLWPSYQFVGGDGAPASYRGRGNNDNINGREPGGGTRKSICDRSTETFANLPCSNSTVGILGNSMASSSMNNDKTSVLSKFEFGGEVNVADGIARLNDESKIRTKNIYYYYSGNSPMTVEGEMAIRKGTIQVVHSNRDVNIMGNLAYEAGYANFDEMPKLVVYAKGNINVSCGVSRIDALLVADGKVTTCGESNNINAKENSNQLIINGGVVASSLNANRTYGAATGANSIIPAEIINYDPTLYLWAGEKTEAVGGTTANLNITYNKELSPRL